MIPYSKIDSESKFPTSSHDSLKYTVYSKMDFKHLNGSLMFGSDSGYASGDDITETSNVGINLIPNSSTHLKTSTPEILHETYIRRKTVNEATGVRPNFLPELPIFSGNGQSIELHISKLDKLLNYYQIPQKERVDVLGLSLDGDALLYFDLRGIYPK